MAGCESLAFQYGAEAANNANPSDWLTWIAEWPDALQAPPRLVDVSMQLSGGRRVTRVLTVPIGTVHRPQAVAPAAQPG